MIVMKAFMVKIKLEGESQFDIFSLDLFTTGKYSVFLFTIYHFINAIITNVINIFHHFGTSLCVSHALVDLFPKNSEM